MDLPEQAHNVQDLAEAWVAANTETGFRRSNQIVSPPEATTCTNPPTSFSEHPPAGEDTKRDVIVVSPSLDDQEAPSVSAQSTGSIMAPPPPASVSRKRKQASPQPCREPVEVVGAPPPAKIPTKDKLDGVDTKHGKMLPVHCSVETAEPPPSKKETTTSEGYAIVPSSLLLRELVRVALVKLDYSKEQIRNATGVIQVKNWKALPFNLITDEPQATVGKILGDLLSYITLKIKIVQSRSNRIVPLSAPGSPIPVNLGLQPSLLGFPLKKIPGCDSLGSRGAHEMRLKLLQLLEKRGPTLLVSHGCPFSQGTVAAILQGKYTKTIQQEKLQSFYQWYNIYNGLMDNTLVPAEKLDSALAVKPSSRHWRRPRTLFDQRYELPRLMSWYRTNPRPSRAELEVYLAELNSTDRRRNSHPLQYSSIAIWFKNARAKYRGLRGLSPDSPDPERLARTGGKPQSNRIIDASELRRDTTATNGTRPSFIQLGQAKNRGEGRSRFAIQGRPVVQKSILPQIVSSRSLAATPKASLSNGHAASYRVKSLLSTPDASLIRANPSQQPPPAISTAHSVITMPVSSAAVPSPVSDIRKIASGFGIMLSPGVMETTATPDRKSHLECGVKAEEPGTTSSASMMPMLLSPQQHDSALNLSSAKPPSVSMSSSATSNTSAMIVVPTLNMAPIRIPTTTMMMQQNNNNGGGGGGIINCIPNGPSPTGKHSRPPLLDNPLPRPLTIPQQISAHKSATNRSTRKRFNIHPSLEVPKLQAWFCVNPKPDRHTIDQFVAELNRSDFRKNQSKYDSRIVYVWFKNARAKYSRQKMREGDESNPTDTSNLTLTYSRVIQL